VITNLRLDSAPLESRHGDSFMACAVNSVSLDKIESRNVLMKIRA
jgi:hypothetical protein